MIPIISVVGHSDVGKTAFLERLVPEIRARGYRVGVVKHSLHGVQLDPPGTDSRRLTDAGGDPVVLTSEGRVWVTRTCATDTTPQAIVDMHMNDVDIVLTEGYKRGPHPKIEVWRQDSGDHPVCEDWELVARVGDPWPSSAVPHFGLADASGVAALLEERFLRQRKEGLSISVNGVSVAAEGFAQHIVARTLLGILSALKGVSSEPTDVVIRWRRGA